ncbi:hypothetical protein [Capnocytophaga sputigena]|nr:hypothetical protein [Capnocytophaga sputigena]
MPIIPRACSSVTNLEGVTYRFRYDAFGRRLEKRRMSSTSCFVWDGNG